MKVPRSIEELRDDYLNTRARMEESLSLMAKAAMFSVHTHGPSDEGTGRQALCRSMGLDTLPYLKRSTENKLAENTQSKKIELTHGSSGPEVFAMITNQYVNDFGVTFGNQKIQGSNTDNRTLTSRIELFIKDGEFLRFAQLVELESPVLFDVDSKTRHTKPGRNVDSLKQRTKGDPVDFAEKLDFIIDAFNEQNPGDPFNPGHYGLNKYENYSLHSSPSNIQDPAPYPPALPDNDWLWRIGD